jgi:hypothetical protein
MVKKKGLNSKNSSIIYPPIPRPQQKKREVKGSADENKLFLNYYLSTLNKIIYKLSHLQITKKVNNYRGNKPKSNFKLVIILNHKNLTEKRLSYEKYYTKTIFKSI